MPERDDQAELAETFGDIARILLREPDPQATLERIVVLAVKSLDGCEHAGVSMVGKGGVITSPASTDGIPALLDRIQVEMDEGPGVDALRLHTVFVTGCLSQERRWPAFVERAHAETAIESVAAFRLYADERTMGALNLYSTARDAFDDQALAIGSIFATHAAVALSASREKESLQAGLVTRALIGQAVGILMAREDISEEQAFDMLRRASQRLNIKLREVADDVVHPPRREPSP